MQRRWLAGQADFYPRSPCGERRQAKQTCQAKTSISIHALLAESDQSNRDKHSHNHRFLSTLSLRRATHPKMSDHPHNTNFYPRSPCGERPHTNQTNNRNLNFYPRSPCGERHFKLASCAIYLYFYPRSPCGERPSCSLRYWSRAMISIHALLAESDCQGQAGFAGYRNFYPRSPCGERQLVNVHNNPTTKFLSTLSLRRATRS